MNQEETKPLHWKPAPGIGYTVERRGDGGMNIIFTDLNHETLMHWREFALEHLLGSDRQTRNLYDLSEVEKIPAEAINFAVEANSDPASRNIRLAVVVANEDVRSRVREITALSSAPGGGTNLKLFTSRADAEEWLNRPLDTMV